MARATADVTVVIERSVSEVFRMIANYENNVRWQDGVVRATQLTPGDPGVGTRVGYTRKVMGREIDTEAEIVVFEPDARIRIQSDTAVFSYLGGYDFQGSGTSTTVHYRGEITTKPLLGFLGKAVAGKFGSQMSSDLARLKALLEAG